MLLPSEGFAQLHAKQLDALAAWVRAGGSTCVFVGGGLGGEHIAFLNALIATDHPNTRMVLDTQGMVMPAGLEDRVGLYRAELGRLVIVSGPADGDAYLKTRAWRQARATLWKARHSQLPAMIDGQAWRTDLEIETPEAQTMGYYGYRRPNPTSGR